jgi:hypothetical protein
MTYENWCKRSTEILDEAEKYNKWADRAKDFLLSNIGPRLAKLGRTGYSGCGFHYGLEQTFGRLIDGLSLNWDPCANWCENIERDRMKGMGLQVSYRLLLKSVRKAERSVKQFKKL